MDGGWKRDIKLNKDDASRRVSSYSSPLSALSGNKKNDSDKEIFTSTMKFFLRRRNAFQTVEGKKKVCLLVQVVPISAADNEIPFGKECCRQVER